MGITEETAARIAELARLELQAVERRACAAGLRAILDWAAGLDKADVSSVPAAELAAAARPASGSAEPLASAAGGAILALAPRSEKGYFSVGKAED